MDERQPTIYILANRHNRTLYTGVTASRTKRVWEHKKDIIGGFTKKYGVHLPACVDCSDKTLCDCHSRESGNPVRIPGTRDSRLPCLPRFSRSEIHGDCSS